MDDQSQNLNETLTPVETEPRKSAQVPLVKKPKLTWIAITVLVLLILGALGYFFRSNIKSEYNKLTGKSTAEAPLTLSSSPVVISNVTFYPTAQGSDLYTDETLDSFSGSVSICVVTDMTDHTIRAKYKGIAGIVSISKGNSPGCPAEIVVASGTFTPDANAETDPTVTWLTFSDETYHFSFKYPSNYSFKDPTESDAAADLPLHHNINASEKLPQYPGGISDSVMMIGPTDGSWQFLIKLNADAADKSLTTVVDDLWKDNFPFASSTPNGTIRPVVTNITVAGKASKRYVNANSTMIDGGVVIPFSSGSYLQIIQADENPELLNNFLSTFKISSQE
ncbi:MAG: hypothetical protein NTW50_01905 [Candidatus Berkelbacteria bacterium]|nr:hypothetical protein [Candidatus Berkelbacteria bacterium]